MVSHTSGESLKTAFGSRPVRSRALHLLAFPLLLNTRRTGRDGQYSEGKRAVNFRNQ